jgi:two-component sensor histidine kinase/CHASE1-domain containing sensor protein
VLTRQWWVRLAIVAIAYIVAGRLALLLAIPPGFATAIWPASAIAVVAVARWGWPAMIAVALGSFVVNLSTGGVEIGAALSLGPAMQAAFGALLIRRAIGVLALERGRDIAKFYVLAGPLACLVAATWGTIVLYRSGAIPTEELAYSWLTWWVGDTVGVMLVAPIVLAVVGEPRAVWRARRLSVGVPLAVVTLGMMLAYISSSRYERHRDQTELELRVSAISNAVKQRVERSTAAVQSVASFLSANRTLEREQFATFASETIGRDANIQALTWAPRVTSERLEVFPALWAEPATRQRGSDAASESTRIAAIQRARQSGEAAATEPLRLHRGDLGFLIVAPVYTRDAEPTLHGVVIGELATSHLLANALDGLHESDLAIAITDITATPIALTSPAVATRADHDARDIAIAGRTWRIDIARVGPIDRGLQAWFALLRLMIVGLLGAILLAITGGQRRIAVAEARNVEVERKNLVELQIADRDHTFQLELGDILHSSESVRDVLARSALRVEQYLALDNCYVTEVDGAHPSALDTGIESDESVALASFEVLGFDSFVRGTRYVISDLSTDERTAHLYEEAYAPRSIRAFVAIPLVRGGDCIAYFNAISATPREWTRREVSLVQSVAERTWLWAEHLRNLHGLRANEQQLRDLAKDLEERVAERTQDLVRAVGERESLLKEIHHRVKNNLQVISSMLNLQARRITDAHFKRVFDESQQRIQSIALVHENLYQSRDLSSIGFDDYLKSLVANVMSAQSAARVTAITNVENVTLPIKTAIPCGLIINELVTNALKYAFPGERAGTVTVSMKSDGDRVELRVADDGVGLPAALDPSKAKTLGLDLVYTFAEQLDATVDVASSAEGATFTLRFPAVS